MSTTSTTRRDFVTSSLGVAMAAGTGLLTTRARGANERLVVGMVGAGGRGRQVAAELTKREDFEVAYVADPDSGRLKNFVNTIEDLWGKAPKTTGDFRRILDDNAVDAIYVATPDHWHVIPSLLACQAGKDVYVEKPLSHNVWEGRKLVEAARKYDRVVQVGMQTRSAPYTQAAVDYLRSGKLGDIHLARVINMKNRGSIGRKSDGQPPAGVDYDMWLGPAPKRPFNPNRFHYAWHWFWDYSGGDIVNDGVHQMDAARWLIDKAYPKSVTCTGGRFFFDDDQETPDTQHVLYEFDDMTLTFELTLWTPYMKKTPWEFRNTDGFPDWRYSATRIELYGTKGLMMFSRHGGGWQVFGPDGKQVASQPGRRPLNHHLDNFVDCVKSRKRPNADVEEGHRSALFCHLGNLSYRVGGRKLQFDGEKETFVGDDEASALLKRTYRAPWVVPEKV